MAVSFHSHKIVDDVHRKFVEHILYVRPDPTETTGVERMSFLACGVRFKPFSMDGFSFAVLERTLELVDDVMSPESDPAVAAGVSTIRRYIESPGAGDHTAFHHALLQLARLAHDDRQFLIAARLEAFAREMDQTRQAMM